MKYAHVEEPAERLVATASAGSMRSWHWLIFLALQLFNLYQLLHHAMWRDELQIWSIVRESATLPDLIHNMRYDGFPALWYILLWFISLATTAPVAMQLFHFVCSATAQLLVMLRAPFSPWLRLALIGGYYISFEYCVISRAYVLGVLLIFCYCAFQSWFDERPVLRITLWGLLANSSVYGAILSLAFVADELLALIGAWRRSGVINRQGRVTLAALFLAYGALFAASLACMLPPADISFSNAWRLHPALNELLYQFCRNLVFMLPVPLGKPEFWNSLVLIDFSGFVRWMVIPIAGVVLLMIWHTLRPWRRYLLLFAIGFTGIWLFTVVKYYGFVRHIGAEMVLFLACIWLGANWQAAHRSSWPKWSIRSAWAMLLVNLLAWGMASYYHLKYDFSGSREMAGIIRHYDANMPIIVADEDSATSSVAGYLGRPLYYASNRKPQTYIRWNNERADGAHDVLGFAKDLAAGGHRDILLLLNYPLSEGGVKLIASTGESIVPDEVFYLYEYEQ